jgi:hypothetical protein
MNWIYMAHYRDQWQALVNKIMNFQVPSGNYQLVKKMYLVYQSLSEQRKVVG